MDIEQGFEMSGYSLMAMGGEASLPTPEQHKKGWHQKMLERDDFDPEDDDEYLKHIPEWTPRELFISGIAGSSVLTSTLALFIAGINPIIYVTAILGITLPPYSAFQEKKITDCKAMRQTNESMTREMENIRFNNERLKAENNKLEGSIGRIRDMKSVYKDCQKMGKGSLQQLEQQLEQSKATLGKMETNRTNEIVDNIFDIMLAADEDQDFFLSDGEIDTMIFKIKGIMNVEVNDAAFKEKVIENGRDLDSIMLLLKDFFDPNYGGEKVIRVLD